MEFASTQVSVVPAAAGPSLLILDRGLTVRSANAAAVSRLGDRAMAGACWEQGSGTGGLVPLIMSAFDGFSTVSARIEVGENLFDASVSPVSHEAVPLMLLRLDEVLSSPPSRGGEVPSPAVSVEMLAVTAALDGHAVYIGILDQRGIILAVNRPWRDRIAAFPELAANHEVGGDYLAFCAALPQDRANFGGEAGVGIRAVLAGSREAFSMHYRCRNEGQLHWFKLAVSPLNPRPGLEIGAVVAHYDISEQIKVSEEKARQMAALQTSIDAVFVVDVAGGIDWANDAFLRRHARWRENGRLAAIPLRQAGGHTLPETIAACRLTGEPWTGEVTLPARQASGDPIAVEQTVTPIPDAAGEIGHFVIVQRDLTKPRPAIARIVYLTEHDEITGLLSRKSLVERLRPAIEQHRARGQSLAVLHVALERFKGASETFGHRAGDLILFEAARRLERSLAGTGLAARIDGDEFAILVPGCRTPDDVALLAERILAALARPVDVDGVALPIGAFIGSAMFPADGESYEALLRSARLALLRARSDAFNGYCPYTPAFEAELGERASIERALSRSLSTGGLSIAFQPQWSVATGAISGAESLLRWNRGARHGISTTRIVSIAEESGLILPIGQWVTRTALVQLQDWRRRVRPALELAVNLSAVQLNQQDVAGLFIRTIAELAIPPHCVKVELTESALVRNSPRVSASLAALHQAGVGLVLDDFGTGYSSLTYLRRFPIESVKIDCSFVAGIGRRAQDEAIVKGIVLLAHSLGLKVVAEGVETVEQLAFLRSVNCDAAQGFLVSPAVPAAEFEALLARPAPPRLP